MKYNNIFFLYQVITADDDETVIMEELIELISLFVNKIA